MSTDLSQVNDAIKQLARKDRAAAAKILERFGAMTTAQLKREDYQAVLASVTKELSELVA